MKPFKFEFDPHQWWKGNQPQGAQAETAPQLGVQGAESGRDSIYEVHPKSEYDFSGLREQRYLPFWAWQFARRNPELHQFYEGEVNLFRQSNLFKSLDGIDRKMVMRDGLHPEWIIERADHYREQWGLVIVNPNMLINEYCFEHRTYHAVRVDGEAQSLLGRKGNVFFEVDYRKSLKQNLLELEDCYRSFDKRHRMKTPAIEPIRVQSIWSRYLELIDLKAEGKTAKEIYPVLYPKKTFDAAESALKKNWGTARKMRDSGFRALLSFQAEAK